MFKSSSGLGLGTKLGAAANKSDLSVSLYDDHKTWHLLIGQHNHTLVQLLIQTYLRNLKKKQKELSKKHTKEDDVEVKSTTEDEEEDSDLASIARELQEKAEDSDDIFNSPFIKRPNQTKVRHTSDNTTPLPEKEFSFIGSGKKQSIEEEQPQEPNTSKALDKFMRFDKKYSNFKVLKKTETSDDEESDLLTSPAKPLLDKSPSPKSRLRRQAEQAGLKLSIPKKISDASTTSEVSDHLTAGTPVLLQSPRSPRTPGSPMFTLENLHDIEELLEDFPDASKSTERGTKENTPDVKDNFFRFEVPVKETSKVENDELENDVIVTEDDVDEELIEIVLSEEQDSNNKQISETRKESPSLEKPKVSLIRIESATSSSKKSVKKEKKSRKITKADLELKKSAKFSSVSTDDTSSSISKSKSKRRRKKDKSRKLSNKSCYYCKHICEYHQDKLKHDTIEAPKSVVNECVQVGQPNAKYGRGHYLFDPTKDAMYQYAGNDHLAFIKSAWFKEIDEKKLENKAHNLLQSSAGNPMTYALSELLRGQLELTSNFLTTQKTLYANYCANLSKLIQEPIQTDFDKVLYPRKYKEASFILTENQNENEDIGEEYNSEFESESSDDDDTIVPTEISVQSED